MTRAIITTALGKNEYGWATSGCFNPNPCKACPVPAAGPDSPRMWTCPDCGQNWQSIRGVSGPIRYLTSD